MIFEHLAADVPVREQGLALEHQAHAASMGRHGRQVIPRRSSCSAALAAEVAERYSLTAAERRAIGALADLGKILAGQAGTTVSVEEREIVYAA